MREQISFSIIIPNFNRKKYIGRCISALLQQTYPYFEVLVIDGKSTDGSHKIIDELAKKDSRIKRVASPKDKGISDAVNIGISLAKGDYSLILGSDDLIADDMVLTDVAKFIKQIEGYVVLCYGSYFIDWERHGKFELRKKTYFDLFLSKFNNMLGCANVFFSTDFCRKNNIMASLDLPFATDYDMWLQFISKSEQAKIVCIPRVIDRFCISSESATGKNTFRMTVEGMMVALKYTKNPLRIIGIYLFNAFVLTAQIVRKLSLPILFRYNAYGKKIEETSVL